MTIPEQKPMLSINNCNNSPQHCFGLGSLTRNANSPCMQDSGFPNHHSASGQKANQGTLAFSESLLLVCQCSSYTSPGTLMGPGRYQRCALHIEHLMACRYSLTLLLSQPLINRKSMLEVFSKSLHCLSEGQTWIF